MKKIISALALACTCIVCPMDVKAEEVSNLRPYVGADVGVNVMPSAGGLVYNVNAGIKKGIFGLEIFYQGSNEENEKRINYNGGNGIESAEFSSEYYSIGADILAYLPLAEKFDLFLALGYGMHFYEEEIDFEDGLGTNNTIDIPFTETAHGARIGAGAMYEFYPNLSARLTARYTLVEMGSYEKYSNPLAVSLGLRYTF